LSTPSDARKSWLGSLTDRYHDALLESEEILSYLESRGIGLDAVAGQALGLVINPDPAHAQYSGWLAIPYLTPTGVVYINFRCLEDHDHDSHGGKYQGPTGDTKRLYNVRSLHVANGSVGITEGELDAVVACISGFPCVGVPGATNWKKHWHRLFEDYDRVIVLGDGDKAGRQFANKVAGLLENGVARPMPEGHDVNSFVLEQGAEAFLAYALA
jgi:DNA primase